ncbi:hypothetical protein C4585_03505 [Candidatus Parcubacteria bacterium]|nr:MAG: hypothetical protein C4585_03505 [Candidatus Parcubacteria bacterium]
MKNKGDAAKPCPALAVIFDDPSSLADRIKRHDPSLVGTLQDLAIVLSAETVGKGVKERFLGMTDKDAGKLIRALAPLVSDAKLGMGMKIIFAACCEELRRK